MGMHKAPLELTAEKGAFWQVTKQNLCTKNCLFSCIYQCAKWNFCGGNLKNQLEMMDLSLISGLKKILNNSMSLDRCPTEMVYETLKIVSVP